MTCFLRYMFQHVFLYPADEPRLYRREIFARRLGLDPERVTYLGGEEDAPAAAEPARLAAAIERAEALGHRRILVLRDDRLPGPRFDERLEARLGGSTRRLPVGLCFAPGAWALRSELFPDLARALEAGRKGWRRLFVPASRLGLDGAVPCPAPEPLPLVSVCCATRRPAYLDNVLANVARQSWPNLELVLVLHGWRAPAGLARRAHDLGIARLTVLERRAPATLGDCLNSGVAASAGDYWCKLDDDDFYDRHYLAEAVEHLAACGADLAGKARFHVFFPAEHRGYVTTPSEYSLLSFPRHCGATIFGRRLLFESLPFEPLDLCEDQELYRAAAKRGLTLCDTGRDNYVYIRHTENTSDFERHLSDPWDLDASPLYRRFARAYGPLAQADLSRLDLPTFARYFRHVAAARAAVGKIPRVIHQIWIGPHPRPVRWMESWTRDFLAEHPGWRYRLWTDRDVAGFDVVRTRAYRHLSPCGRADLLRYRILHREGGVYVDADSIYLPGRALDPVLDRVDRCGLVMAEEPFRRDNPPLVAVGVIAAVAGNPLLDYFVHRGLAAVEATLDARGHLQAWETTGPLMATEVLEAVSCRSILPSHVFFPEYWDTKEHWGTTREELARRYPESVMFQFGYSTNELLGEEGGHPAEESRAGEAA